LFVKLGSADVASLFVCHIQFDTTISRTSFFGIVWRNRMILSEALR
jgi:hypothetical protein